MRANHTRPSQLVARNQNQFTVDKREPKGADAARQLHVAAPQDRASYTDAIPPAGSPAAAAGS